MESKYRFIGKATVRKDATEIVTGSSRFLNDIKLVGMLHGKVLRSPHPHAFIKRVDKTIGVGEVATSPGPSAVLMAVSNAIGIWLHEYPVTPEKVLRALKNKEDMERGGTR
jgi:CO/xanthine dehydrogenase Mo-binding subunit